MSDRQDPAKNAGSGPEMGQEGQAVFVDHPTNEEISTLCMMGRLTIPGIASDEVVKKVVARNKDSLFGIFRHGDTARGYRIPLGFYANLLLTPEGVEALKSGELSTRDPQVEYMVPPGTRPAAIYSWAVMAPGLFEKTLPMLADKMGDLYLDLPILTSAATEAGKKTVKRRGFQTGEDGISSYEKSTDARRSFKRTKS